MDLLSLFCDRGIGCARCKDRQSLKDGFSCFFLRHADGFLGYACFYYSDCILLKTFIYVRAMKFLPRGIEGSQAIGINQICAQHPAGSITQLAGSVSNPFVQRSINLAFLHPPRPLEIGEPPHIS